MRVHAFRGIRYSDRLAEPGSLAAPPYDQIGDQLAARLRGTPHHFAWLTRPLASDHGDAFETARVTHEEWLQSGILQQERTAALYPYEILMPAGGRRLGLTALVGLEDPQTGEIRPHEATVETTVDERLGLLRSTGIDLEPILLLSDDDGELETLLTEDASQAEPLVRHQDSFGNVHRLFRVDNPERIELYRRALSSCPGLIADGHHRYEVARRHAAHQGLQLGSAGATKLAVISSLRAPGLTIDPIHRGLRSPIVLERAEALASSRQACEPSSGMALATAAAAASQPALVVLSSGQQAEVWSFTAEAAPAGLPPSCRHLAVSWLHEVVLPGLGFEPAAACDGTLIYRSNPERLFSAIAKGQLETGFWLPPISPQAFSLATSQRVLLPPKSTRFMPKVASGLVWARLHADDFS